MRLTAQYLGCTLLVLFYVNLFPVLEYVYRVFGDTFVKATTIGTPIIAACGALLYLGRRHRQTQHPTNWILVIFGLTICLSALFIPDPKVSIKRIHVSEYLLLSLCVRYVMSQRIQGGSLLLFSSFFTVILGVHDEFLQGLHPQRTYGMRDMLVNGVAGVGGGLIWHGFNIFSRNVRSPQSPLEKGVTHIIYLLLLSLAVLVLITQLYNYPSLTIPIWPCLPLVATSVLYFTFIRNDGTNWSHGLMVTSYSSFFLLFYPFIILVQR